MYFWHFLANVSCRISRASGGFAPSTPTMDLPWICLRAQNASPQIHSCREVIACCASSRTFIPHVIYKQQTQEKHINFDEKTQGKMDGNHQKLRENDAENSVQTLHEKMSSNYCRQNDCLSSFVPLCFTQPERS